MSERIENGVNWNVNPTLRFIVILLLFSFPGSDTKFLIDLEIFFQFSLRKPCVYSELFNAAVYFGVIYLFIIFELHLL